MRTAILTTLLFVFALGVWAQQSDINASSNSGAAVTSTDREPLTSPRPKDFWDGDDPNLVNLVTHPFANKKYVQRHVGPIHDRLNELEQITAENSGRIKDVNTRAQQGMQLASDKTALADQHASDATNKAQLAQAAASQAAAHVSATEQKVANLDRYQGAAQTEIRFRPGQSALTRNAKNALDDMASPLKGQRNYIIEVRGFAPGQGQAAITSARKMADSVVRYLVLTHNIPVYRIHEISLGNEPVAEVKHLSRARVEVSILKNDVVTSAQR